MPLPQAKDAGHWRRKALAFRAAALQHSGGYAELLRRRAAEFERIAAALEALAGPDARPKPSAPLPSSRRFSPQRYAAVGAALGVALAIGLGWHSSGHHAAGPSIADPIPIAAADGMADDGAPPSASVAALPSPTAEPRAADPGEAASPTPSTVAAADVVAPAPAEIQPEGEPHADPAGESAPAPPADETPRAAEPLPSKPGRFALEAEPTEAQAVLPASARDPVRPERKPEIRKARLSTAAGSSMAEPGASDRRCATYTAPRSLTGLSGPVRGLACRRPDGHWLVLSESPDR